MQLAKLLPLRMLISGRHLVTRLGGQQRTSSSSSSSCCVGLTTPLVPGLPKRLSSSSSSSSSSTTHRHTGLYVAAAGPASASADASRSSAAPHTFMFTSESVTEGHPDKICDQVSDAVLDSCLAQDPNSRVACETAVKDNFMLVFGEITSHAEVDYDAVARAVCDDIGYNNDALGFNASNMEVKVMIRQQVPEIAQSVDGPGHTASLEQLGAGDQGHMFGYATDETPELMPLTHTLASQLAMRLADVRRSGLCEWARPDGKTQVTIEYERDGGHLQPLRVHTLLISAQHSPDISYQQVQQELMTHVVEPVIPQHLITPETHFFLNPSTSFILGGPVGDAGLTGRKIIVDTYGGWGAHGGGAFSGKDPTKVDRSGAYIARQAAKSVVAAGLASRCLVQVSYGIGLSQPLSVYVDTYRTGKLPDEEIQEAVMKHFDFRPGLIIQRLDLRRGGNKRYQKTAAYGHFGRNNDPDFSWEQVVPLS